MFNSHLIGKKEDKNVFHTWQRFEGIAKEVIPGHEKQKKIAERRIMSN